MPGSTYPTQNGCRPVCAFVYTPYHSEAVHYLGMNTTPVELRATAVETRVAALEYDFFRFRQEMHEEFALLRRQLGIIQQHLGINATHHP